MPFYGCSCGVLGSALVALLIFTAPQLLPDQMIYPQPQLNPPETPPPLTWADHLLIILQFPPLHLLITIIFILFGLFTSVCGLIQRKNMERRLLKMKQYLRNSVERLRALDTKQEQLETTLKLVQNATCEYNLLLYLLQRHRGVVSH